jgi:inner membrane protein involved in colicin E2 resistance
MSSGQKRAATKRKRAKRQGVGGKPTIVKMVAVVKSRELSPEARRHKLEYDKKYESSPERVKYREELNQERRRRGIYGSGDHKDVSHTQGGRLTLEGEHSNRARHFKNRGTLRVV